MFEAFAKTKYRIVLLRHEYKTMNVVVIKILKTTTDFVKIGTKTYKINWEFPSYNNKLDKIYFIDYEKGHQILFKEVESELNPSELDMIVGNHIMRDLLSGIMDNKAEKLMFILAGGIIGLLSGLLIMQIVMQQKIDELYGQFGVIDLLKPLPKMLGVW